MEFEKRKAATLSSLTSSVSDKSPKGTLDIPIIPLITAINLHPSFFTTSSCSGRISILSQPPSPPLSSSSSINKKKKARGGTWLFVSHSPADSPSLISLLFPSDDSSSHSSSELVFRFEPLIVAVECRDLASAHSLVSLAISCGFRESGITNANKRIIIAIRCSIRLEVPLGDTRNIMVTPEYVSYLVRIANDKMEANRLRTDRFLQAFLQSGSKLKLPVVDNGNHLSPPPKRANEIVHDHDHAAAEVDDEDHSHSGDTYSGSTMGFPGSGLPIDHIETVGEPVEKLFLWGHSACAFDNADRKKVVVFGGFGGLGRHARRNDLLLLDPYSGNLETISTFGNISPSPRLGHTASLVGDCMFVIGGRTGPDKILSDVWVLDTTKNCWKLLQCGGFFLPRHRHAAAVMGSNIYVFGGLDNDTIFSSFYILDTINLHWKEIPVSGDWPCARHSHAMVASDSHIFIFGGYNGGKALGDLYCFDVQNGQWKKEKTAGRNPHARFSHSVFVYKNYLGVLGGCPVRQHCQELALLDLKLRLWKHVTLNSVGKDLFVRSTAIVVGDDLIIVGGGASCYAFGTKFSEPAKVSLLHLMHASHDDLMPVKNQRKHVIDQNEGTNGNKIENSLGTQLELAHNISEDESLYVNDDLPCMNDQNQAVPLYYVLQLEKKYAKLGKDMLKKLGWLDLGRKAYSEESGVHICFPVVKEFVSAFHERNHHSGDALNGENGVPFSKTRKGDDSLLNQISCSTALTLLHGYGAILLADEVVEVRKAAKSPLEVITEAVTSLIEHKGLPKRLLEELPTRWDRLGDIVILPATSFKDSMWDSITEELWPIVAKSLKAHRLARQGPVAATGTRDSTLQILVGDNGWVNHRENGILYSFDATKCMFSWGNLSEKLRMGSQDCKDEVIVDLFAGIGYFVLPFLVRAQAKLVYACEWNPHAIEALRHNLLANSVADRCIIFEGDNRIMAPQGVADRVCLGLIPSSESSWVTAVRALRREGGMLHVHGNTKDSEECQWIDHVSKSIHEISRSEGYCWEVSVEHVERVKWYAPHIRHVVADVKCRQIQR